MINTECLEINVNNFRNRKKLMIKKLEEALQKNEVDTEIIPHISLLNDLDFVFTTSSCSGRIALIDAPLVGPKRESEKVYRWHEPADPRDVLDVIRKTTPTHVLWLKYDSFIIAFSVASIRWAEYFIKLARYLNLKDSGIRSINPKAGYINMDFMSTEKMSAPVKIGSVYLTEENYLHKYIIMANFLLRKNKLKLQLLYEVLILLVRYIDKHKSPPPLSLFDPIIQEYRTRLNKLKVNYEKKFFERIHE